MADKAHYITPVFTRNKVQLHINLADIQRNYNRLSSAWPRQTIAAVVKANAYGIGMIPISRALYDAGCRFFYVAHTDEAISLRHTLPEDAKIAVLHGIQPDEEELYLSHEIISVINDLSQYDRICHVADRKGHPTNAILHIDTGMNRLGISTDEALTLLQSSERKNHIKLSYVMTHMACASAPEHAMNHRQWERFHNITRQFPDFSISFAASGGAFHDFHYHADQIRCGIAILGSSPVDGLRGTKLEPKLEFACRLYAPIIQKRTISQDGTVGYNATYPVKKGQRIVTVPMGYADGYLRQLSTHGVAVLHHKSGISRIPVAGIISMDLSCFDVSSIPEDEIDEHSYLELLGPNLGANELGQLASTNSYNVFTNMGHRIVYRYHYDGELVQS